MKHQQLLQAALALITPALAIPPPSFGFPEAPNDTALVVAFPQASGSSAAYITVGEADKYGAGIPANEPILAVNTTAYTSLANYTGTYLVCMVDPDASYPENPSSRFILHWLQPNLTQQQTTITDLTLSDGTLQLTNTTPPVVPYRRPSPPTNSSAHRYIIYAFQQPANFAVPAAYSGYNNANRTRFNLTSFIRDAGLPDPAAANYFYVSNQTNVPQNFTAAASGSYPGGDGEAVTSGDPYRPTASASGGAGSSSSSSAGAAVVTGLGGLVGAGLVGLAALL